MQNKGRSSVYLFLGKAIKNNKLTFCNAPENVFRIELWENIVNLIHNIPISN